MSMTPPEYDNTPKSWKELEAWAFCNHPGWHRIYRAAEINRQDDYCTMRQLVSHLLSENVQLKNKALETAMNYGVPHMIIPSDFPYLAHA